MFKPALAAAETLTVRFSNLTPKGTLMMALYKGEDGYNSGKPVGSQPVSVSGDTATATFEVEPGQYGIKVFHDLNDNGKMDFNPFGMPVEPFAFSNNAKGRMGPAVWADAAFAVNGDTTQDIAF